MVEKAGSRESAKRGAKKTPQGLMPSRRLNSRGSNSRVSNPAALA